MPRLPTVEEWRRIEEDRLEALWDDIGSTRGLTEFFDDVALILQARLDTGCRIRIAQGMARFCRQVASALEPDAVRSAKGLVQQAHKRMAKLQKLTTSYESQLSKAKEHSRSRLSAQAGRECWAVYQDLQQCCEKLEALARSPPAKRLSAVTSSVRQALMEVGTPFRYNDYGSALRRLDELLGKWKAATHASERQAATEQALSNLICYAAEEFQEATGEAPGPANRLRPFLQCILKALPDRTTKYHGVRERDEEGVLPQALQKRVSRQLVRSQRAMQRKPQRAT